MAAILGVISLGSLGIMLFLSYQNGGQVGAGFGAGALLAALYSTIGLVLGLVTVQEKERYRLFPGDFPEPGGIGEYRVTGICGRKPGIIRRVFEK